MSSILPKPGGSSGASQPNLPPGFDPNDPNIKRMQTFMESCFAKSVLSGVMGFGMGGLFGGFMASMQYDTPFSGPLTPSGASAAHPAPPPLSTRRQVVLGLKDMGSKSYSMAKNFGTVGALFAGIECGIEGLRAKNDLANGVAAGCLTGGILARNGGPLAACGGCAAFAAFSLAIDAYMRNPSDE